MMPSAESGLRRLDQIERTAHRVTPVDVGLWVKTGKRSVADSVLIAPADLAWLIAVARGVLSPVRGQLEP